MDPKTAEKASGQAAGGITLLLERPLKFLSPRQICAIDDALARIAPFGEVRLIKSRGRLRFIEVVESHDLGPGG